MPSRSGARRTLALLALLALSAVLTTTAHAVPGDVDPTFDAGAISPLDANLALRSIAVQADGRVLIGGSFSTVNATPRIALARLNADGSVDATFQPPLQHLSVSSFATVKAIAVQADGRIVVGGKFIVAGVQEGIVRLNADGSLDDTFAADASNSLVNAIVLQPDGKIVAGGDFGAFNGVLCSGLVRLNTTGTTDQCLGTTAGLANFVYAVALQADGKFVVGGNFFVLGTVPLRNNLARINADGTLDTTFNVGSGANNLVYAVAAQPDGKVLAGGIFDAINGTVSRGFTRLATDGTADAGFVTTVSSGGASAILLQPSGRIIVTGSFSYTGGEIRAGFARFNANGSLDSFYPASNTGADGSVWAITAQPDGKPLIAGNFFHVGGVARSGVARLADPQANVAPVLGAVVVTPATINENGTASVSGTIFDANPGDAFVVTIDWGDGTAPQAFNYPAGTTGFLRSHQYLDDNPTATGSDVYPVTVTLADSAGATANAASTVTVVNLAPAFSIVEVVPSKLVVGGTTTVSGSATDVGTLDTKSVVIAWGDGSPASTVNLAAGASAFSVNHTYAGAGAFTISLLATDDDGGTANASANVTVTGTTGPPNGPTRLTARGGAPSTIDLAWRDMSANESGFRIERCMGKNCTDFVQIAQTAAGVSTYPDTGLNRFTVYTYRVRAFNADGNSPYSNEASARTSRN